ncbi:FAD-dependent oxidoreductase [Neorhizobium lilium]|uniref:FAD-dependent oxidoreductase n=1 Tax=Neorhizobium lilium TaxID=2503024 RepID=A0A3S3RPF6_9HYPH|nr:FAD/NAD(P)-binding protein [Neorhizobium lilium]RWX81266.1 FAD-dependent oxidoreductase [Neorhizobium lilium]
MNIAAKNNTAPALTVAIIGGGFTGAAVAYHLARHRGAERSDILVFEPRSAIGKGLAYDSSDPTHRINVPAGRMSLFPDQPEHFALWLASNDVLADDPGAYRADGSVFPRRSVFGDYVLSQVKPLLEAGLIRHIRAQVMHIAKTDTRWQVEDSEGNRVSADILVIAATHPAPQPPARLASALEGHPRYVADATRPDALEPIRTSDRVLVVGNGLTAADVIASLRARGHKGRILSISRRGLRSRGHPAVPQEPYGDFLSPPPRTALELLMRARTAVRAAEAAGFSWHAALDQVRAQARPIWQNLPIVERRRLVGHLRVFWDVHRFRIAPQVEQALDQAVVEGDLEIAAGSILSASRTGETMDVVIRRRGGAPETSQFDAVVITTGPAHGGILASQPWLSDLAKAGSLTMDPTGLGLGCNEKGEALDLDGKPQPDLLIAGPLARGVFGELMGLPQVSEYAAFIADRVARSIAALR